MLVPMGNLMGPAGTPVPTITGGGGPPCPTKLTRLKEHWYNTTALLIPIRFFKYNLVGKDVGHYRLTVGPGVAAGPLDFIYLFANWYEAIRFGEPFLKKRVPQTPPKNF
jgi:hypothetical protein